MIIFKKRFYKFESKIINFITYNTKFFIDVFNFIIFNIIFVAARTEY